MNKDSQLFRKLAANYLRVLHASLSTEAKAEAEECLKLLEEPLTVRKYVGMKVALPRKPPAKRIIESDTESESEEEESEDEPLGVPRWVAGIKRNPDQALEYIVLACGHCVYWSDIVWNKTPWLGRPMPFVVDKYLQNHSPNSQLTAICPYGANCAKTKKKLVDVMADLHKN